MGKVCFSFRFPFISLELILIDRNRHTFRLGSRTIGDERIMVAFRRELFRIRYRYVSSLFLTTLTHLKQAHPRYWSIGGNHFRAYKQNGTEANSGAWFLAVSKEVVRIHPLSSLIHRVLSSSKVPTGPSRETQNRT